VSNIFKWTKEQYLNAIYILGLTELTSLSKIQEEWYKGECFSEAPQTEIEIDAHSDETQHIYFEALISHCEDCYL
jgi:hypothetical protein